MEEPKDVITEISSIKINNSDVSDLSQRESEKDDSQVTLKEQGSSASLTSPSVEQTQTRESDSSSKAKDLENNENHDILKDGTVQFLGVNRGLQLTSVSLKLKCATQSSAKIAKKHFQEMEIPLQHLIWSEVSTKVSQEMQSTSFTVHYMQQEKKRLRAHSIIFTSSEESRDGWISSIQEQCIKVEGRPRKVFVVVNPIGGAGNARQMYERKVLPLLQLAHIDADVVYTERSKHAKEIGENQDFSAYDGIVIIGGDGLYQEVLQGVTIQMQKSAGVDYNDVNTKFVGLDKPFAIIPGGTGNGVSGWVNSGLKDVETATLRIVKGEIHRSQIFTVHSNGKFFCVCGLLFGYGSMADMIKRTDELRWMKRARYPYCMIAYLFKKKRRSQWFVEYRVANDSQATDVDKKLADNEQESHTDSPWIKHDNKGKDYVGAFSFMTNPTDKGDHFTLDLFADRFRLYLDTGCSTISSTKALIDFISGKKRERYPENLDVIDNVRGVRVKVVREEGAGDVEPTGAAAKDRSLELYLDVDGECLQLDVPEFDLRVVPSYVPLYACKLE